MKKVILIAFILLCLLATGCDNRTGLELNVTSIGQSSSVIEDVTTETTGAMVTALELSDNIKEIDLSLPENSSYLQYKKDKFTYNNEYTLSDGQKIIEDKNLYLEDLYGNRILLIEVPSEDVEMFVVFGNMIDNNRFYYYIINHESTAGTGVYNLETGEDYRIDISADHCGYVPVKVVDNYLLFNKGRIADLRGFGKLNLDNYEFTEIDFPLWRDDKDSFYWGGGDFSPDGTKAVIYSSSLKSSKTNNKNKYQVSTYSLMEEKVIQTYSFYSDNDYYVNHQLIYYSDNQVYLYVSQYGNNPKDYLYIIDLK